MQFIQGETLLTGYKHNKSLLIIMQGLLVITTLIHSLTSEDRA
jgi:hypothetical protein